jgi:Ca2+/H+ antiporter, TMEM165/GDT1 family
MNKLYLKIPAFIILGAVILFLIGSVTMLLWNELLPKIFNVSVITFWQALGLILLSKILFSGAHPSFKDHRFKNRDHDYWHKRFDDRLNSMSAEEKEKFKARWENNISHKHDKESSVSGDEKKSIS